MRALVVDDDDCIRSFVALVLQQHGWVVDSAPNGQMGWQMAQLKPYAMVICDIVMPGQDGFETMRLLRMLEPPPFIVAISGGGLLAFDSYLGMALKLGADRALSKPFARRDLEALIREVGLAVPGGGKPSPPVDHAGHIV